MEDEPSTLKMTLTLAFVCLISALILAVSYGYFQPIIDKNKLSEQDKIYLEVFPKATSFEKLSYALTNDSCIKELYLAKKDNDEIGKVAICHSRGYGGNIEMMIGISEDKVTKVKVLSNKETPGLGTKVAEYPFLSQFDDSSFDKGYDTISGATISSSAVISGVKDTVAHLNVQ